MNQIITLSRTAFIHSKQRVCHMHPVLVIVSIAVICQLLLVIYAVSYILPGSRTLSYAGATCVFKPTLLPGLHKIENSASVTGSFSGVRRIGGYPVTASSVCVTVTAAPKEQTTESISIKTLGIPFITAKTNFTAASFPGLTKDSKTTLSGTISTKDSLKFALDKPDGTFTYQLGTKALSTTCSKQETTLSCDVAKLNLAQAQAYELALTRTFKNKPVDTLLRSNVTTVTPIVVTSSSITNGSTVYDAPGSLAITFDRSLAAADNIALKKSSGEPIAFTKSTKDAVLTLTFAEALPRNTSFNVTVGDARATDKGFLAQPFVVNFSTSGGPKVIGSSLRSHGMAGNSTIRLTFDTAIKPEQAAQFFQLVSGNAVIPATVSVAGNTVTINPGRNFTVCEQFTVKVTNGLQNSYGISGDSAWQSNGRTTCFTTFSIGTSAEGRSIVAYKFGSGPSTVLYVAATHGSEPSSRYTLDSWVSYLDSRAPEIPANRSIVVIPNINPDGSARSSRTNARGVDLNRNFPANNWKADVTMPGGQLVTNGGGTAPLSEPESAALAAYTLAVKPRLVLTYHAKGSIVTANESGDSMQLAAIYGKKVGYRAVAESQLGATFNYDTTGAYENWLHDKAGIPTLLIELPGNTSNYFTSNRDAMWAMVTL